MILEPGNKILAAHRHMFDHDADRYFLATVEHYEDGIVKATGYSFAKDEMGMTMVKKKAPRTKLISLVSGTHLIYQLPDDIDIRAAQITGRDGVWFLADDSRLSMDLTETMRAPRS